MARVPEAELERLKADVPLVRLIEDAASRVSVPPPFAKIRPKPRAKCSFECG